MSEIPRENNFSIPLLESEPPSEFSFLFEKAEPEQQIAACSSLIYNIIMEKLMSNGNKDESMRKLADLLYKVGRSQLVTEKDVAEKIIELTVAVLDISGIDLISHNIYGLRFKYHRQVGTTSAWDNLSLDGVYRGDKEWMFMTKAELEKQLKKLPPEFLRSSTPVSLSQLFSIQQEWSEKIWSGNQEEIEWYIPFLLNDEVGGLYSLAFKSKRLAITPRSELPIQDVITAYLQSGVSSIGDLSQEKARKTQPTPFSRDEFDQEENELWHFVRNAIPAEERMNLSTYLKRDYSQRENVTAENVSVPASEHYQKEFGEEKGLGKVYTLITRSGVSANAVAIGLAKQWVGEKTTHVMEGKGWYFENSLTNAPDPQCQLATQIDQAHVLLINAESNAPLGPNTAQFFQNAMY